MLVVLLGAALAFFGVAVPANATTGDLGGMELTEYCQALGYQGAEVSQNGQSNPWVCFYGGGAYWTPLDLFGACRWQFGDLAGAGFKVTYAGNGRCWATNATAYSSPSDLNQIGDYCRSLGYSNAVVAYRNVAGWRCSDAGGGQHPLNLHAACRWVNSGLVAQGYSLVSYFNNYGDTFAIRCLSMKHT
jgi:hypothetical protein